MLPFPLSASNSINSVARQSIDTLRRSRGLDVVLLVAGDGTVSAAWHGGERDSGRFTKWLSEWRAEHGI
jgi:carbamoyltransferase